MEKQPLKPLTFDSMPNAVQEVIQRVSIMQDHIIELKSALQPKPKNELLTRNEVAELLKCDLSTIHNWTKKGKLKKYCLGDRIYYKLSEIESSLIAI